MFCKVISERQSVAWTPGVRKWELTRRATSEFLRMSWYSPCDQSSTRLAWVPEKTRRELSTSSWPPIQLSKKKRMPLACTLPLSDSANVPTLHVASQLSHPYSEPAGFVSHYPHPSRWARSVWQESSPSRCTAGLHSSQAQEEQEGLRNTDSKQL